MNRRLVLLIALSCATASANPPASPPAGVAAESSVPAPEHWIEPLTGMNFVRVSKGCFQMGTKAPFPISGQDLEEAKYKGDPVADERPEHQACVSEFWIGRHEVRADDWQKVMGAPPPEGKGSEPAAGVSWRGASEFAGKLTAASDGLSEFRLPTEAEWEMACLAGEAELVTDDLNFPPLVPTTVFRPAYPPPALKPRPLVIGTRQPNGWGIFDMRGNVAEWVADSYIKDAYKRHPLFDPLINDPSGRRVLRGGSHRSEIVHLRCASRSWYFEDDSLPSIGLRVVRKVKP